MSSRSKTKRSIGEVQPSGFFKRKTFIRWRDIEEGFASYRRDKNWAETRGESGRLRFQSLVGTIKTIDNSQNIIKVKRVSIPHRYDKNPKNACSIKLFGLELFSAYHVSKILSTAFNLDSCRLEALKTIVVDPPGF
jgi:hypothetical protein